MFKPSQDCSSPMVVLTDITQPLKTKSDCPMQTSALFQQLATIEEFENQIQTSLGKTQNYQLKLPPSKWAEWYLTVGQHHGIPRCPDVHNWVIWVETWHNPSEYHGCRSWQSWTPFTNVLPSGKFFMLEAWTAAQTLWLSWRQARDFNSAPPLKRTLKHKTDGVEIFIRLHPDDNIQIEFLS